MAEEDIMMEEDSVALQDTDDSTVEDANVDPDSCSSIMTKKERD